MNQCVRVQFTTADNLSGHGIGYQASGVAGASALVILLFGEGGRAALVGAALSFSAAPLV